MNTRASARGVGLMVAANAAFCAMAIMLRSATGVDSTLATLFRFMVGLGILGGAAMMGFIELKFANKPVLLLRGFVGGVSTFLFYLTLLKLGLYKSTVLSYSYPVFAAIFGFFILAERLSAIKVFAVANALFGIALLASGQGKGLGFDGFGFYETLGVAGAVLSGLAVVLIKKLHDTDSTVSIFFAQCLVGFWLMVMPAGASGFSVGLPLSIMLVGIGIMAAVGQLFMTAGYRHLSATTGSLMAMLVPIFNTAVAVAFFREPLSLRDVAGSVIVLTSCLAVLVSGGSEKKKAVRVEG